MYDDWDQLLPLAIYSRPDRRLWRPENFLFVKCIVGDSRRRNVFPETKVKTTKHSAARRIMKTLFNLYFFSEKKIVCDEKEEAYVICQNKPTNLLKILKYCYVRGRTVMYCNKQIKRSKRYIESRKKQKNILGAWC